MKITKIQITTAILIIIWIIWEIYLNQWAETQVGAIIRVDLLLIYPVIAIMIIISFVQLFKRGK